MLRRISRLKLWLLTMRPVPRAGTKMKRRGYVDIRR
jgi:hypothetical protein